MGRTAQIEVIKGEGDTYEVMVDEFVSARDFTVTLSNEYFECFARGRTQEEFIRDAFRFLLIHEPKEDILSSFDIADIVTYFPEFEKEI